MRSAQSSGSQPWVATSSAGFIARRVYSRTAATCATFSEKAAAISARV